MGPEGELRDVCEVECGRHGHIAVGHGELPIGHVDSGFALRHDIFIQPVALGGFRTQGDLHARDSVGHTRHHFAVFPVVCTDCVAIHHAHQPQFIAFLERSVGIAIFVQHQLALGQPGQRVVALGFQGSKALDFDVVL